jgi:hypothetical protein
VQLSHGDCRLHFSFRCRQGAHDKGIRFRLRTTLNWSGEAPECDEVAEGGVGVIFTVARGYLGVTAVVGARADLSRASAVIGNEAFLVQVLLPSARLERTMQDGLVSQRYRACKVLWPSAQKANRVVVAIGSLAKKAPPDLRPVICASK